MRRIKTKIVNSLSTLLIILFYACNRTGHKVEVVTIVDKKENRIEKGSLVNGRRERVLGCL